jgi:transcription initiation factor TFIID subunit 11
VSGIGSAPKKKRGRKAKNANAGGSESKEQTPSLVGGRAPTTVSGAGGDKDAGADDDDDVDGPLELVDANARTQEQKQEETRLRAMLVLAMDKEQEQRFELWRASKLPDAVVRRVGCPTSCSVHRFKTQGLRLTCPLQIVNATVSQSVPANVVLAVRSVAKVFIGQLIESARRVQTEQIEVTGEAQAEVPEPPPVEGLEEEMANKGPRRGPLRPEHLREAFYRYQRGAEGGGVGLQALWHAQQQDGVERFGSRTGGRRLFK